MTARDSFGWCGNLCRQRFPPAKRDRHAGRDHRLSDAGRSRARPRQCGAGHPWQHQRSASDRSRRIDGRGKLERDRRSRQSGRHQPLLCRLSEHAGLVLRIDQCGEHRSLNGQAVRAAVSRHHRERHRRDPEGAARSSRHRETGCDRRPVLWRHPGLSMGGRLSRHDEGDCGDRHLPDGAARTRRGQCATPARDPVEGSELERRRLLRSRRRAGEHDPDSHQPRSRPTGSRPACAIP